ncbi:hypothetical protein RJ641_009642 [Dillenia turbinata]|uniref:Uncharacterized protein n=1 Tax=Dillenia turbinata TaxID=194707 RepID=A0AAN8V844_9MAGN
MSQYSTILRAPSLRFRFRSFPPLFRPIKTHSFASSPSFFIPLSLRLGFGAPVTCSATRPVEFDWRDNQRTLSRRKTVPFPFWNQQQSSWYGRYAYDEVSDDDSDKDVGSSQQMGASTLDNIDEWRWKLTMLLRSKQEQEVVSREKKDRRDFEQLSALANRMGLHSRQYSRVVVFSKVPLPNYRSDLDDKRPQREVVIPSWLQSEVNTHLKRYLSRKPTKGGLSDISSSKFVNGGSTGYDEAFTEQQEPFVQNNIVMERILRRKSLQLRYKQQDWQESAEGQKMQEFRRSLPAYKEKDALLKSISENQKQKNLQKRNKVKKLEVRIRCVFESSRWYQQIKRDPVATNK